MTTPTFTEEQEKTEEPVLVRETHDDVIVHERRGTWKILAAAAGGLLLVLLLSFIFLRDTTTTTEPENVSVTTEVSADPIPISTTRAVTGTVPDYIEATGTLLPFETTDVAPEAPGQVVATPVNEGTYVRRGQVVARLNDQDARLRVQQAQASLEQAQANLKQVRAGLGLNGNGQLDPTRVAEVEQARAQMELAETNERRYRSLVETGDVSQAQYDEFRARAETARKQYEAALAKARSGGAGIDVAEGAVSSAKAQLGLARKLLSDMTIVAPLDGYVVARPAAVGEWVTTSTPVVQIVQSTNLKLQLLVAEADAGRIHVGMPVSLRVDAFPGRTFNGSVTTIIPALDPSSRSLSVIVVVRNETGILKPGMFATGQILDASRETQSVLVPALSIVKSPTGTDMIYVIEGNKAVAHVVQAGHQVGDMIEIVEGISEGDEVATNGFERLKDGAVVITNGA